MMLSDVASMERDVVDGRFLVRTRLGRRRWEVIVEPDERDHRLVVVTAYAVERGPNAR